MQSIQFFTAEKALQYARQQLDSANAVALREGIGSPDARRKIANYLDEYEAALREHDRLSKLHSRQQEL